MHKTDISTKQPRLQQNVVIATLSFDAIHQQLRDAESLGYIAQTLNEITYDQIDSITELRDVDAAISTAVARIDALTRSVHRSVLLMQEAVELALATMVEAQVAA